MVKFHSYWNLVWNDCDVSTCLQQILITQWSIRVGDSAQVVAEWSDHRWVAAGSPGLCSWQVLFAWCGWPPSSCASCSLVVCLGLLGCPWKHCVQWQYRGLLPQSVYHTKFQSEWILPLSIWILDDSSLASCWDTD